MRKETTAEKATTKKPKQTFQEKKPHKLLQHKNGENILIKVIWLMEVTAKHAEINAL